MSVATPSAPAASTPVDLTGRADGARLREFGFQLLMLLALLVALGFLVALLWDILSQAVPFLNERGWAGFVTDPVSTRPESTGLGQAIVGSIQIGLITMGVAFPLGIATAVYLEEYAEQNMLTRIVDINIRNLAGVPSIVYGLLGLAIFVELMGFLGGSSVLAGGLTLALLALPIVTIAAAEALRAVPRSLREGGYGLGATRWQVTKQLVLPNAAPGILTGMILAVARAIGETAPLIVVGAATFLTNDVRVLTGWVDPFFTAIPIVVFNWARLPQPAWREQVAPSGILILLLFTLGVEFSGKTVLVVGGTSGIGNGIAHGFRESGATVHVTPRDSVGYARFAIVSDPERVPVILLDPYRDLGGVAGPGGWAWAELWARDPDAEAEFYHRVVGYERDRIARRIEAA